MFKHKTTVELDTIKLSDIELNTSENILFMYSLLKKRSSIRRHGWFVKLIAYLKNDKYYTMDGVYINEGFNLVGFKVRYGNIGCTDWSMDLSSTQNETNQITKPTLNIYYSITKQSSNVLKPKVLSNYKYTNEPVLNLVNFLRELKIKETENVIEKIAFFIANYIPKS